MDNKIFKSGLMGVGQERYFYKLKELSSNEMFFLKAFIEQDNRPLIRKLNHGWLDCFNQVFNIKRKLSENKIFLPKIDERLSIFICNFEEDLHEKIESDGIKFLHKLYDKDVSFYEHDEELISFMFFICQQYFRTQRIMSNAKESLGSFHGLNIDAMWPILRHISATNVGFSLYQDRRKFRPIIVENTSGVPFITGDQPVINTCAIGLNLKESPEELEFYYPLTPSLAFLLTKKPKYKNAKIIPANESEVLMYNQYIYQQSSKQVYASQKQVLERLLMI